MPDARLTTKREGVNIRRLPHFDGLNSGASIGGGQVCSMPDQRPTAGGVARPRMPSPPFSAAALRIDQRSKILEAVSGDDAGGYQFPKPVLHFARQTTGGADQIGEEGSSALAQLNKHFAGGMRERGLLRASFEPLGAFTQEDGDGCGASGADAARLGIVEGRMRREPGPHDLTRQTQAVEKFGLVAGDPPRNHFGLPGGRGYFVALELFDDLERAVDAVETAAGHQVLPAKEESLELRCGDRFDFAAKRAESEAMDTGEDAAVAPLKPIRGQIWVEVPAHDLAFGFQMQQSRVDDVLRESDAIRQRRGSYRADRIHPATHDRECVAFQIQALGRDPKSPNLMGAARGGEFGKPRLPILGGRK